MMPAGLLPQRRLAVGGGDEFVGREEAVTLEVNRHAQRGRLEAPAGGEILHHQLDAIDQPAAIQLLHLHDLPSLTPFGNHARTRVGRRVERSRPRGARPTPERCRSRGPTRRG